jgi:hypothetical protein
LIFDFFVWRGALLISHEKYVKEKIKYQSSYLKPYCGLEEQKPTQALQSVKGPGNTFDINYKWSRTLPSLTYFSWDINRAPLHKKKSNIKVDI